MDRGTSGGGGKTPRGRKSRGSSRGRGHAQDSTSPRTSATGMSMTSALQSPSVTSSSGTSSSSRSGDEQTADIIMSATPTNPEPVSEPSEGTQVTEVPSPSKFSPAPETKPTATMEKASEPVTVEEITKSEGDVKEPEENTDIIGTLPHRTIRNTGKAEMEAELTEDEDSEEEELSTPDPDEPILPPPIIPSPQKKWPESTASKVGEALGKAQPRQTGKTLVVTPPSNPERATSAPLTVEIDPSASGCGTSTPYHAEEPVRPSSQGRAGSVSPAGFGYAPVGKPGFGRVSSLDEEADDARRSRRTSSIAEVQSAARGFTKRQWILLVLFGTIDLLSSVTISLQAPFYPAEAEKKGATPTEYGFVFGIFEFVIFLTSPIYGKYMNKLGPKRVFSVCILLTSVSVICFGLLDRINDHAWFITLCFICRIFEALGCGGFFTATFTIIACEFPDSVATTFASLETFFGLGFIVGPTLGGALFDLGGFQLPFFVVGSTLLFVAFLSSFVMPKIDKVMNVDGTEQAGYGVWTILKIPSVALAAASIASTALSLGFISATLEPHIRSFGLTPLQTGLVFVISGGVYALTAPIWGYVCDNMKRPVYITILGNALIFVGFLFIGPAAFIPLDSVLWVTILGLAIQGLGFGCCLVSGFVVGLKDSLKSGLPNNMATYGVASGLWTSMISLGAFVGPSAAGVLFDTVGFRNATYLVLVMSATVGIITLIHTIATRNQTFDSEYEPLLPPTPTPISPLLGKKGVEADPKPLSYGSTSGGNADVHV